MRPVIPKVRVGEVLHGTRNLRNWLRTSSMLEYFKKLSVRHMKPSFAKEVIYTPSRGDEFIVCANARGSFCVWSPNRDVVLLFLNPLPKYQQSYGFQPAMDPSIFAKWFVRTNSRRPDLNSWPNYAYQLWAALHVGGIDLADGHLRFQFQFETSLPFAIHQHLGGLDRATLKHLSYQAIREGIFRGEQIRNHPSSGRAFGPSLEHIPDMRAKIQNLCADGRLLQKAKGQKGFEYEAFVANFMNNN